MGVMEMGVEEFLEHTSRAAGGSYLKNWKDPQKGGKGYVDVVLHRGCAFSVALWRHGVPKVDIVEDERTKEPKRIVRYGNELCPESEDVLKKKFWRDRTTGELQVPPVSCPIHLLQEHLYQLVHHQQLALEQEVFRFDLGDGKPVVLHAGGICGLINDDMTDAEEAACNAVGVYKKDAWKESWHAKLNYVFRVVDVANVAGGCQIAVEPNLLGDKMKAEIRKAMMPGVWGPQRGNPIKNPYVFRWESHPEQQEFQKKYEAVRMEGIAVTPEVMRLITETEPPSIDGLTKQPVWPTTRAQLERAACVDLPWDEFFGGEVVNEDKKAEQASRPHEVQAHHPQDPSGPPTTLKKNGQPPKATAAQEEMFACEGCNAPIGATEPACRKCGYKYTIDPPVPPPPLMRKRSEAQAVPAPQRVAPAPRQAPVRPAELPKPVKPIVGWESNELEPTDDIPF